MTIIHIGHHKTGTSYLQQLFKQQNCCYLLNRAEIQEKLLQVGSFHFNSSKASNWLSQEEEKARKVNKRLIISEEELSGNIHTGGGGGYVAKEIANRLFSIASQAQIVIFIRNQIDMIESAYRQYVKKGGTKKIKNYMINNGQNHRFPLFSFEHLEYEKIISYYIKIFGKKNVHVFLYEEFRNNIIGFIKKFFEYFNLELENELSIKIVNPSYTFISVKAARFSNLFYSHDPINNQYLFHFPYLYHYMKKIYSGIDKNYLVRYFDNNYYFLTPKLKKYINERYKSNNKKLSKLINIDLSLWGYPI